MKIQDHTEKILDKIRELQSHAIKTHDSLVDSACLLRKIKRVACSIAHNEDSFTPEDLIRMCLKLPTPNGVSWNMMDEHDGNQDNCG